MSAARFLKTRWQRASAAVFLKLRWQMVILTAVVCLVLVAQEFGGGFVDLRPDTALLVQFFSAASTALAALLGLIIAFLIFSLQRVAQKGTDARVRLREQVCSIFEVICAFDGQLDRDSDAIEALLTRASELAQPTLPAVSGQHRDLAEVQSIRTELRTLVKQASAGRARYAVMRMLLHLDSIEDARKTLVVCDVELVTMRLMINTAGRLVLLLGISMVLLITLGAYAVGLPTPVRWPLVAGFLTLFLLSLGELTVHARLLHRDVTGELKS